MNGHGGVAYIGGTFDLFHHGHVHLLRAAKERFGVVVVGLNRDDFVARFKLRRPVMTLIERMNVVAACRYVDSVIVNVGDEDSRPALLLAGATHFVHGSDWTGENLMRQLGLTKYWLAKHGIRLVYFPYTVGISTTEIIGRMRCEKRLIA